MKEVKLEKEKKNERRQRASFLASELYPFLTFTVKLGRYYIGRSGILNICHFSLSLMDQLLNQYLVVLSCTHMARHFCGSQQLLRQPQKRRLGKNE